MQKNGGEIQAGGIQLTRVDITRRKIENRAHGLRVPCEDLFIGLATLLYSISFFARQTLNAHCNRDLPGMPSLHAGILRVFD